MPRIHLPERDELSSTAQALYDEIAGPRGGTAAGPFGVWLLTPKIARGANELGNALRLHGTLDRAVFELITLVCAAHWNSTYPWVIHKRAGLGAGLTEAEISAIEDDEPKKLNGAVRQTAYAIASAILEDHELPQPLFEEGRKMFGEHGLIEITTAVGFYSTASIVAKIFDVEVPTLDGASS